MENGPVRFGLVGMGGRMRGHIGGIRALPGRCRITATCDPLPERARAGIEMAGGGEIRPFTSHTELLSSGLCDAITVSTPNYTHGRIVVDALRAGHHVVCEKPMTTTLEEAREVADAVRETGRVFLVSLQFRYIPIYNKVKELLDAGEIGELKYVWAEEFRGDWRTLYEDPEEDAARNWRFFQHLSGGTIVEKVCHDLDILGWLIGREPLRVAGNGGLTVYEGRDTLDHATVLIEYEGGVKLTLGVCMFSKAGRTATRRVGTDGLIEFSRGGGEITITRPGENPRRIKTNQGNESHSTRELYADFLDAISAGRQPRADVRVGCSAMRIAVAAEQAAREHRVIEMDRFP